MADSSCGHLSKYRGRTRDWIRMKEFETVAEALEFIKMENCWSKARSFDTKEGMKVQYRCNKVKSTGKQCPAAIQLLYHADRESVSVYRTDQPHDHVGNLRQRRGLPMNVRRAVVESYEQGMKSIGDIISALKRRGLPEPRKSHLNNFIQVYRRLKRESATHMLLTEVSSDSEDDPDGDAMMPSDVNYDQEGNMVAQQIQSPAQSAFASGTATATPQPQSTPISPTSPTQGHIPASSTGLGLRSDQNGDESLEALEKSVLLLKKRALAKEIRVNELREVAIKEFQQYIAEQRRYIAEQRLIARGVDISQIPIDIPPGLDATGLL